MDSTQYCAEKLKALRESKNMTQQELADDLKISQQQIARYENAQRYFKDSVLQQLADYFKVSVNTFFPETDYKLGSELDTMLQSISKELDLPIDISRSIFINMKLADNLPLNYENVKAAIEDWLFIKYNETLNKPVNELDLLYNKYKDLLTDDDKEHMEFIINKRIREIDKQLDGE